ncbi:MAG: T9SS type A sorting domain-containing protein, partial [Lewinella sp.]|nr:T9SS type A sorting domain-containing protein [Lewinella sp.]
FFNTEESRYVMMNKGCATDGATLIHELGHFYGLYHTHETSFGREYVDGTNCEVAGDLLCDTPADPNLGTPNLMSGCSYVGKITDPKGESYVPPVNNFMSYAPSSCVRFFSAEQLAVIESVHEDENAYLVSKCDFYPDFAISSQVGQLSIRSDQKIDATFDISLSNLKKTYEATLRISLAQKEDEVGFLLHEERIELTPGERQISLDFALDFPIVLGTGDYFLKAVIDSDNEIIEVTEKNNTFISSLSIDNSSLSDLVVFPNPALDELKVFLRNEKDRGDLYIQIYRYDGRLVWEKKGFKSQNEYFQLLDISQLSSGMYIVQINFLEADGRYAVKFFKR